MPLPAFTEAVSERTRSWGAGLVAAWMAGVFVVLIGLAYRESRLASAEWSRVAAALASQPGWRLRHVLPAEEASSRALLDHLASRGRLPGLSEVISGPMSADRAARLRDAGWVVDPDFVSDPSGSLFSGWLEIHAPDGGLVWRGAYQASDLASGAGVLREDLPLAAALTARPFPPFVPALCATNPAAPPGSLGTAATPKSFRGLAYNLNIRP